MRRPALMSLMVWAAASALCCASATSQERASKAEPASEYPEGLWSERWISPSAYAHYLESRIHHESGRLQDALSQATLALAFDGQSPYLYTWRARLNMETQDLQAAHRDLDKARSLAPGAGEVSLMEARLQAREGDLRGAARLARRARMLSPHLEEAWRAEAHWRQELGELGQARRIWLSVVEKTPQDIGAQLALGEVCAQEQRLGCAQAALGRVTALRPDVELGWLRLGSLLEESGKFSRAYETYALCTQEVPVATECWLHRVQMRERLSAVDASPEHHQRQRQHLMDEVAAMADAVAGVPGAAQDVARRLGSLEDPHLLEHFVGRCSWRREGLLELSFFVGNLYERQGHLEQAARSFAAVPRGSTYFVESRTRLAVLLSQQGHTPEALKQLDLALEEQPQLRQLYLLKAALLQRAGKGGRALETLERGVRALPEDDELHHQLGSLAQARGERARALQALERATELRPDDPEHWELLGDMRLAAGRQQQAREAYRQALSVSTDEEERMRLQEILDQAENP